jgi:hypothetical protein
VSHNKSSYERTSVILAATEMVLRMTKDGDRRRVEIGKIVFAIADQGDHDAHTLAHVAIAAMDEPLRKIA